jgi:hypothetical protein
MPKFEVTWTEHTKYSTVIDTDSIEDAVDDISYGNHDGTILYLNSHCDDFYHREIHA